MFSTCSEPPVSRKTSATSYNQVSPISTPTDIETINNESSEQVFNSNLILRMQIEHLQQRNRELQSEIKTIQSVSISKTNPSLVTPPPNSSQMPGYSADSGRMTTIPIDVVYTNSPGII